MRKCSRSVCSVWYLAAEEALVQPHRDVAHARAPEPLHELPNPRASTSTPMAYPHDLLPHQKGGTTCR